MSNIELFIKSEIPPVKWKDFIKNYPEKSIALDGFVIGKPNYDNKKIMVNFNHHEDVDRLATSSTSAQVLFAIRLRLFDYFRDKNGNINMNVFVNDCDEDICTAWFLLKHAYMSEILINPSLNRLVTMEDFFDRTSGTYPYPKDSPILEEMAWVYEPYRKARKFGLLKNKDNDLYKSIISDVENRIMQYIIGRGQRIKLDTRYEVINGGKNWKLVNEIGEYARTAMISDGIAAFISVKELDNNKYQYILGKISPFFNFNITLLLEELNKIEGNKEDLWGGSNTIGGSPRVAGSKITPQEITIIVNDIINKENNL